MAIRPALLKILTVGLFVLAGLGAGAPARAEIIDVTLDKAKIMRMPAGAETVIVGNPVIADVTTLKSQGLLVVTGKGFGETNMIFLDSTGTALREANVRVESAPTMVTVQRGMDRESYSCQPRCQPTVSLGDATAFLKDASGQISSRNTLATPTTSH